MGFLWQIWAKGCCLMFTMNQFELEDTISCFTTRSNRPVKILSFDLIGVSSHYYRQQHHLRHQNQWKPACHGVPHPSPHLPVTMCGIHDVLIPLLDDKGDANAIGDRDGGGQCTMDMQQDTHRGVFHCDNDAEQHDKEHCTVDSTASSRFGKKTPKVKIWTIYRDAWYTNAKRAGMIHGSHGRRASTCCTHCMRCCVCA